jgi:alpha-1,2-mannosyltransferase
MIVPRKVWLPLVMVAALCAHAWDLSGAWRVAQRVSGANDFASYYYATVVGAAGEDPYEKRNLGDAAREEGTRRYVHPFFYPPPFLLWTAWAPSLPLHEAYKVWFWLDEALAVAAVAALARAWRGLGSAVAPTLCVAGACMTAIPNNHLMGQANLPVLLLAVVGLALADRDRPWMGGALVGFACMMKMSPALFVAWWLLRGRWRPAVAACAAAVALSVAALPWVALPWQVRFYTEVLPGFGTGSYNGLGVGIDLPGNHSLPNLIDLALPPGPSPHLTLSDAARGWTAATSLAVVAGTFAVLRRAPEDALGRANAVSALMAVMLLVPVITYEHHLVWLLPGFAAGAAAVQAGRVGRGAGVALAVSAAVACAPWEPIRDAALSVGGLAGHLLRESKMAAIVGVLGVQWAALRPREAA